MNPINDPIIGNFFLGVIAGVIICLIGFLIHINQEEKQRKHGWNIIELDPYTLPNEGREVEWITMDNTHQFGIYDSQLYMFHPHEDHYSVHADNVQQWRYFKEG